MSIKTVLQLDLFSMCLYFRLEQGKSKSSTWSLPKGCRYQTQTEESSSGFRIHLRVRQRLQQVVLLMDQRLHVCMHSYWAEEDNKAKTKTTAKRQTITQRPNYGILYLETFLLLFFYTTVNLLAVIYSYNHMFYWFKICDYYRSFLLK